MRFIETVLLTTHETLHVKKYTLYSKSNVSYILFDIYGCFDVRGFWKSSHIWRYRDIFSRKRSRNTPIGVLFWTFLLGKLINSVDRDDDALSPP